MVHKEGGGPTSKCKIEKNAIKYGLTDATHQGRHTKCSSLSHNATSEQTIAQCEPDATHVHHYSIVTGLSKGPEDFLMWIVGGSANWEYRKRWSQCGNDG